MSNLSRLFWFTTVGNEHSLFKKKKAELCTFVVLKKKKN